MQTSTADQIKPDRSFNIKLSFLKINCWWSSFNDIYVLTYFKHNIITSYFSWNHCIDSVENGKERTSVRPLITIYWCSTPKLKFCQPFKIYRNCTFVWVTYCILGFPHRILQYHYNFKIKIVLWCWNERWVKVKMINRNIACPRLIFS